MRTSADAAFVDTNVLVYAVYQDSLHHGASRALLDRAQQGDLQLCLAPQVLMEFYAVVTNPRRVSPAKTPQEAVSAMKAYAESPGLLLLPFPSDLVWRVLELVQDTPAIGQGIFDLQLAATMLGQGVRRIYTFNTADFQSVRGIEAINP